MVKKQVGFENNASLEVSQQVEQLKQQQQQQQLKEQQQQEQHQQRIDIDLTPEQDQGAGFNYAQQANAIYAPLKSPATQSYEKVLPHRLHQQHALLATTPYNLNIVPSQQQQQNNVAVAVSSVPLSIMPTEIPAEDEERLEKIFNQLDRDGDGKIDIHDLSAALHEFGLSSVYAVVSGNNIWESIS